MLSDILPVKYASRNRYMQDKIIKRALSGLSNAISSIGTYAAGVTVLATIGIVIRQWLKGIDLIQFILIMVILFCLVIVGITYFLNRHKRHSIIRIPDLLYEMDTIVREYVSEPRAISIDDTQMNNLTELINIKRDSLERSVKNMIDGDLTQKNQVFNSLLEQTKKVLPSNSPNEMLTGLLFLSGMLDSNAELATIKNSSKYQPLSKELKKLKQRAGATINEKVNNYLLWSDGLYPVLFEINSGNISPQVLAILPVKVKVSIPLARTAIEMFIDQRLSEVLDAVNGVTRNESNNRKPKV